MNVYADIIRNAPINPVSRANKAVSITKNADGSMLVIQGSGDQFTIAAEDITMQAFVVLTMADSQMTN